MQKAHDVWIEVTNRLPQPFTRVLASCVGLSDEPEVRVVSLGLNGQWFPWDADDDDVSGVTHWQPWPQPARMVES